MKIRWMFFFGLAQWAGMSLCLGSVADALKTVRAVGPEGQGNAAATTAWKELATADAAALPELLAGMDGANSLAQNWLRTAVETLVARSTREGQAPVAALTAVLEDTQHDAPTRVLAYEMLKQFAPDQATAHYPALSQDPVAMLRVDAVADLIRQADEKKNAAATDAAKTLYQQALDAARDKDQIDELAKKLADLGVEVDLPKQFGFLMNWHLIAPFTNVERSGFDTVFPPEEKIDLSASYPGKGQEAKWVQFTSQDDYGMIDFNKPFDMLKEVTGYAYTEFDAAEARDAEIRLGCKNAWKVWLNGQLLFARDEYHRGMQLDQYILPCHLQKGANTLLVKCCQNEQTEQWTVEWQFQLRICDATGTAIAEAPAAAR
ncbi:MAG: hypothetical protein KDK99_18025 [Verrucomicrobiales bacterium]|nr:hypothetical protein [Verrucomicrobiales bacterium]